MSSKEWYQKNKEYAKQKAKENYTKDALRQIELSKIRQDKRKEDHSIDQHKYYIKNREKILSQQREQYKKDPILRKRSKLSSKAAKLRQHGWTLESAKEALVKQNNCCALCGKMFTKNNRPCADHEHSIPPKPRELLHHICNSVLGLAQDDPKILEAAAAYLRKWGK